ncbi:ITA6-like protein [Mya arenaria]|uniref:ITA6-like protein n=1 Tax=Mya arenaria TaxID=6604 RepID=A0ABY7D7S0_MYAAR|nr:ITA6-like protein [Mya arenaria]
MNADLQYCPVSVAADKNTVKLKGGEQMSAESNKSTCSAWVFRLGDAANERWAKARNRLCRSINRDDEQLEPLKAEILENETGSRNIEITKKDVGVTRYPVDAVTVQEAVHISRSTNIVITCDPALRPRGCLTHDDDEAEISDKVAAYIQRIIANAAKIVHAEALQQTTTSVDTKTDLTNSVVVSSLTKVVIEGQGKEDRNNTDIKPENVKEMMDTSIPVVKKGPDNSYFGFSVAQHQELKKFNASRLSDEIKTERLCMTSIMKMKLFLETFQAWICINNLKLYTQDTQQLSPHLPNSQPPSPILPPSQPQSPQLLPSPPQHSAPIPPSPHPPNSHPLSLNTQPKSTPTPTLSAPTLTPPPPTPTLSTPTLSPHPPIQAWICINNLKLYTQDTQQLSPHLPNSQPPSPILPPSQPQSPQLLPSPPQHSAPIPPSPHPPNSHPLSLNTQPKSTPTPTLSAPTLTPPPNSYPLNPNTQPPSTQLPPSKPQHSAPPPPPNSHTLNRNTKPPSTQLPLSQPQSLQLPPSQPQHSAPIPPTPTLSAQKLSPYPPTLALLSICGLRMDILVGAPNLNIAQSNENNTGGIFKCNALSTLTNDCQLLLQDEYASNSQKDPGRENQWLGVVVRSGGAGKGVADEHLVMGSPGAINWRGMLSEVDVAPTFAIKRMYRSPTIDSDPFDNTDRMYYVSGAPRSFANGQVVFFTEMTSGNFLSYDQSQILSGELPFSGFGHEVLAVDLNNDGYDDLVVGCPYYFNESDSSIRVGGAVYVYIGNGDMRIYATDLEDATGWSTFGYSLSGGMDLDQNSYPDLLVGSYVDNKVAFLRTRPIINLHSKVTVSPDKLNMSSSAHRSCSVDSFMYYCVEIKLCLRYTAEPVERLLSQSQTGLPDARDPKFSCVTQTAYLKSQFTDVLNPIEFGISYNLPERTEPIPTTSPGALPDINEHPILDTGLTQAETMVISKSNLLMTIDLPDLKKMNNKYVLEIGDQTVLRVAVEVENKGEIAYQASFFLVKPESLVWKNSVPAQGEIGCFSVNSTLIECNEFGSKEMGKPLFAGDKKNFDLFFQIKKSVMSSEELTKESDTLVIPITVFVNADLQVSGQSEPDSAIPYSGDIRGESAMENERMIGPSVNHTFTVYNNGPGTVEASEITIFWPYEVQSTYPHGKHLLYLMNSPQVISGDATCFDQPEIINVVGIEVEGSSGDPGYTVQNKRRRREVNSVDNKPMEVREEEPKIGEARERKNIALLDFRHVDEVHIRSKAKIFIRPELNVLQEDTKNDVTYARTVAIPSIRIVQEKPLEWWIYALAILGGLCGFFKRQRYDSMTTYNVKVEKKRDIKNPTHNTKVETHKDYIDENECVVKC